MGAVNLGNFIQLVPAKGLYFEILIFCSMAELIIQSKPFCKDFGMFDLIVV